MSARAAALLALALALSACGGGGASDAKPAAAIDVELDRLRSAAQLSYRQGRYDQAVVLYRSALDRAGARDDAGMLADLGYELTLTELRRGKSADALAAAQTARAELARRGIAPFAELLLAEAVARYRLGDAAGARALTEAALAAADATPTLRARARFLAGELAADAGDRAGAAAALAAIDGIAGAETGGDRAELEGRIATLDRDPSRAAERFVAASDLRRETIDYPGMARALARAAAASEAAGRGAEAAALYLRAGRSAALAGGAGEPRAWLARAAELGRASGRPELSAEANALLARLDAP